MAICHCAGLYTAADPTERPRWQEEEHLRRSGSLVWRRLGHASRSKPDEVEAALVGRRSDLREAVSQAVRDIRIRCSWNISAAGQEGTEDGSRERIDQPSRDNAGKGFHLDQKEMGRWPYERLWLLMVDRRIFYQSTRPERGTVETAIAFPQKKERAARSSVLVCDTSGQCVPFIAYRIYTVCDLHIPARLPILGPAWLLYLRHNKVQSGKCLADKRVRFPLLARVCGGGTAEMTRSFRVDVVEVNESHQDEISSCQERHKEWQQQQ
jgi:hypothetical protein